MLSLYYIFLLVAASIALLKAQARISLFFRHRRFARKHGCKLVPKGPTLDPILGIDHFLTMQEVNRKSRFLDFLHRDLLGAWGSIVRYPILGSPLVWTNSPENMHAILALQFHEFNHGSKRCDNFGYFLGATSLLASDGPVWQSMRAAARPSLARRHISHLALYEKHVQNMLRAMPVQGRVDLQEWAFRYTLDAASEFFMDKSVGILDHKGADLGRQFAWAFGKASQGLMTRIRFGRLAWLYPYIDPDFSRACKWVQDYVDEVVREAVAKESARKVKGDAGNITEEERDHTFLSSLIRDGMSPRHVQEQVLTMLFAARDTTAALVGSACYELVRQPAMQTRLRDEIEHRLHGCLPTYDDLKNITYLNWFIKEALRMYPPAPVFGRKANRDTTLPKGGGPDGREPVFIAKGQALMLVTYSMHRRRDLWGDDADTFRPERWETARPLFNYLPFSAGPRICIGQQLALIEAGYVITRLIQEYSTLEAPEELRSQPWIEGMAMTCCVGQGAWANVVRRGTD